MQFSLTSDNDDESMGAISCTSEESVPLYLSILDGENVNLEVNYAVLQLMY